MTERPEISAYKLNTCASSACSNLIDWGGVTLSPGVGGSKLLNVRAPAIRSADLGSERCLSQPATTKSVSDSATNGSRLCLCMLPNLNTARALKSPPNEKDH